MIPTDSVSSDETRSAEITSRDSGQPLGACLYLSAAELHDLGIDVESVHEVTFSIEEETGKLIVEEGDG